MNRPFQPRRVTVAPNAPAFGVSVGNCEQNGCATVALRHSPFTPIVLAALRGRQNKWVPT